MHAGVDSSQLQIHKLQMLGANQIIGIDHCLDLASIYLHAAVLTVNVLIESKLKHSIKLVNKIPSLIN